jgi:putative DNA primase/helicase
MKNKQPDQEEKIVIEGEGVDEWGNRYFEFSVQGSDKVIPPFRADQIDGHSELFPILINAGASLFTQTAKNELLNRLQNRKPEEPGFKVATRLGWNGSVFVFPDEIVGTPGKPLETSFRDLDAQILAKYRCLGTLEEWHDNIGALCLGNSRLMFALALACTGPVLRFLPGDKSGGFQFVGPGETGKTACAMVAGSFWGCHLGEHKERGFCETWHTTAGKLEHTALAHNDTVLLLDETKLAGDTDKKRGQTVIDVTFRLSEGNERQRLTNVGSIRAWRFYFLSTSNLSLAELAQVAGRTASDAEFGRLTDRRRPPPGR